MTKTTVGISNWQGNNDFAEYLKANKGPKDFKRCSEKTMNSWFMKYNEEIRKAIEAEKAEEARKRIEAEAEARANDPADNDPTAAEEAEAETKQKKQKKQKKEPVKKVADIAAETLAGVDPNLYTVDKKGRFKFDGFFITFKKQGIRFAPGKQFRKEHPDVKWESHPGWDNEFTTDVTWDFVKAAIDEIITAEAFEAEVKEVIEQAKEA